MKNRLIIVMESYKVMLKLMYFHLSLLIIDINLPDFLLIFSVKMVFFIKINRYFFQTYEWRSLIIVVRFYVFSTNVQKQTMTIISLITLIISRYIKLIKTVNLDLFLGSISSCIERFFILKF